MGIIPYLLDKRLLLNYKDIKGNHEKNWTYWRNDLGIYLRILSDNK
jgi:hypothetical protein